MNFNKEQLLAVNGLQLTGIIDDMNESRYDELCKILFDFIKYFHDQEIELKVYLQEKRYIEFYETLSGMRDTLKKIYAVDLVQSINMIIDELKNQEYKIVEEHFLYVLMEISKLSIDIQMARHRSINGDDADINMHKNIREYLESKKQKIILAVDDVSFVLSTLSLALNGTGNDYKLIGVRSGTEALKYLKNHTPDMFILDIEMPDMDGYELARRIKRAGQNAPIIFLTGNTKEECVYKAIEAGAADFILKPVNNAQVLEKIKQFIG